MTVRVVLLLCLILLPAPAFAQDITGVATDARRSRVLPGVSVDLWSADGGAAALRTTVTDSSGRYQFRDVPPGNYAVRFTLPGFNTLWREALVVAGGAPVTVDTILSVRIESFSEPLPPFRIDPERRCLHGNGESAAERVRREEALTAMQLIDQILRTFPGGRTESPRWEELSDSTALQRLRSQGNDLAITIRWGTSEPLPGWGIAWVTSRTRSRYALIDLRDRCGFTYSSEDPDVLESGQFRVVPLTS